MKADFCVTFLYNSFKADGSSYLGILKNASSFRMFQFFKRGWEHVRQGAHKQRNVFLQTTAYNLQIGFSVNFQTAIS